MGGALDLVLADDQVVFLDAMTTVLTQLGHHVIAAVTTRKQLVERVGELKPDICLTESKLSDGSAVNEINRLRHRSSDTKIVVLTANTDAHTMRHAMDSGASGYIHKTRGIPDLVDALRRVTAGEIVIEGSFSPHRTREVERAVHDRIVRHLTERELECLALLAAGLDTVAMAGRLGVASTTVRTHVQSVLMKLGVHSRLEAASLAMRHGLVTTHPEREAM
ncbi:MAG TPA: response regulator transcription factor [Jatrophihabitans sp.]|nr:response regulator transcription factor [Jatrophihabitans sp.]